MTMGEKSLVYAVRMPVVAKYLSQLTLMFALVTLAPLLLALVVGDWNVAIRYGVVVAGLVLLALPAVRLPTPAHVQSNEALTVVAFAFVFSPLAMTYPLMAAGLDFGDALFEAISGITTTGLTTLVDVQEKPATFLFARAWMQWYGGLGIAVLSVALLMGHHVAARRLMEPVAGETMVTTARGYARHILFVYLVLTVSGFGLLWFMLDDSMLALLHVLTSVSTGGFSPLTDSLAGLDGWPVRYAVMAIAFCGAVPLIAYFHMLQRGGRALFRDVEVQALVIAVLFVAAVVAAVMLLQTHGLALDTVSHAVLLGVSAQTGTGFSSTSVNELNNAGKLVLIVAMFIGGGVGSTAGGIKLLRLLILLRLLQLTLRRTALAEHAVVGPRLGAHPLKDADLERAVMVILLFAATIVFSWLIFLTFGHAPLNALFEVVSATATVGLSTGITGSEIHPVLQGVLCADMLLGRLEIVALLVVLYPPTWFGKRRELK